MRRLPIGLTLAAALGIALLIGLGVWQVERLAWKKALLARIAALQGAAPQPLGAVLARAARGEDVAFQRVETGCAPPTAPPPMVFRYALRDGEVGWRLLTFCRLGSGPYTAVLLDRGLVMRFAGLMAPRAAQVPDSASVIGVLREAGAKSFLDAPPKVAPDGVTTVQALDGPAIGVLAAQAGVARPSPYFLAVERETPAPPGIAPAALPQDIPNNHFVYALTWFALAGALAWIYGAMVWRRMGRR